MDWQVIKKSARLAAGHSLFLVIAAAAYYFYMEKKLLAMDMANDYLKYEINKVDREIREIEELEQKRERILWLLELKDSVSRSNHAVSTALSIASGAPAELVVNTLELDGSRLKINGFADAQADITELSRMLTEAGWQADKADAAFQISEAAGGGLLYELALVRSALEDDEDE